MAINATDVKIMRSERVSDNNDGGGQMTGIAIESGDVNNLWDDISRSTLAYGGVSLRKLFCAVRSANVDKFLGGHAMIVDDSNAENVSTLLFSTGDHYDERLTAQKKIEQFVVLGTRSPLRPVGTQREGQSAVVLYAESESDAPKIGDVLVFTQPNRNREQYVKVTRIEPKPEKYTYVDGGDFKTYYAYEFTIGLAQALDADFEGSGPSPVQQHATEIYKTQPSSSAQYYGIKPLSASAIAGESTVNVSEIFSDIVPTATTETALLDQKPGLVSRIVQSASPLSSAKSLALGFHNGAVSLTLPSAIVPGTLKLNVAGSLYRDAGKTLRLEVGIDRLKSAAVLNAVDGIINLDLTSNSSITAEFVPGVAVELVPYTDAVKIDSSNRQLTYSEQLSPVPLAGSLRIEYQYLGEWYELHDDADGVIAGEGASGVVNYETGSLSFSLPAEPDSNSSVIYTWARSAYSELDDQLVGNAAFNIPVGEQNNHNVIASSMSVSWSREGIACSATADAVGNLSGDATGVINSDGLFFSPVKLPDSDVVLNYDQYISGVVSVSKQLTQQENGELIIDMGVTNIQALFFNLKTSFSVMTTVSGVVTETRYETNKRFYSDENGTIRRLGRYAYSKIYGVLDSVTGIAKLNINAMGYSANDYVVSSGSKLGGGQFTESQRVERVESQVIEVTCYNSSNTAIQAAQKIVPLSDLDIDVELIERHLVPGSVWFDLGGVEVIDRGDGFLYRNWSAVTAAGIRIGQVNYSSASLLIDYSSIKNDIASFQVQPIAFAHGVAASAAVTKVVFRTQAEPLRPSGLQFLARRASDTALLRADSTNDGSITGGFDANDRIMHLPQPSISSGYNLAVIPSVDNINGVASGSVDYETGLVEIYFGAPVILSTLSYNAVAYDTVPLSPEVLGLNPVKLPTNGKVPIFQAGYLVVIHNTKTIELATPTAGQIINCNRENLAQINIVDSAGMALAADQFSVDKEAGLITLADPFSAVDTANDSLIMPLRIQHRIEDMCAVGGVNIDGTLKLMTPLLHDYDTDSFVSSVILFGTMQGRIHTVFTQKVDEQSVFQDAVNGESTVASYDDINYTILIDNHSAVQERWKIKFTNSTQFELIGETLGVVAIGNTDADFSPINPMTGSPYFTIKESGWGSGWVSSNIMRFNTDAAAAPIWAIRTVLPSNVKVKEDSVMIEFRGDAD